jgi:hypothetical protein
LWLSLDIVYLELGVFARPLRDVFYIMDGLTVNQLRGMCPVDRYFVQNDPEFGGGKQ